MALWKSSNTFGINYYMNYTPDNHNYFPGGPVSSRSEAGAEMALGAAVALNHNSVLWAIWNRGIIPMETRIIQYLNNFRYVLKNGNKTYGVLIVATVFESAIIDANTMAPQRAYFGTHIEGTYPNYDFAAKQWASSDKLLPAKDNWKTIFYHIWAKRC